MRQTPAALHTVLSQLSFDAEIPELDRAQLPGSVWNGLFCFSLDDDDLEDLFFDAQQSMRSNASYAVVELRGGDGDGAASETCQGREKTTMTDS